MPRDMSHKEINLTQQDLAFKQALLTDVEAQIRDILPKLVTAIVNDEFGMFINDTIAAVNELEAKVNELEEGS
jgi:hypothetical protein